MWNTIIFSLIYYRCCQDVNVYATSHNLNTGTNSPRLFLPLSPLLSMGKFKDRINSNVSNYLFSHNFGRAN